MLDLIVHRPDMPLLPANAENFPLLGFGLWTQPTLSALLEFLLVAIGSLSYWFAAKKVPVNTGKPITRAAVCAILIAVSGLLVLCLDYTS
jgi:hypothetical protein